MSGCCGERQRNHRARDCEFVGRGEKWKSRNDGAVWSGAGSGEDVHRRGAAAGFDESHLVEPADLIGDADAVDRTRSGWCRAEQNVLAVVDDFAGAGMLVGRSAAAEEGTLLEERDAEAGVG